MMIINVSFIDMSILRHLHILEMAKNIIGSFKYI